MTELWLAPWAPGFGAQRPGSLRAPAEPGDVPAPCGNILEIARSGPRRTGGTAFHQLRGGRPAVLCRQVSALFLLPFRCVTFVSSDFFFAAVGRPLLVCGQDGPRRQRQFSGAEMRKVCGWNCKGAPLQLCRSPAWSSRRCGSPAW